MKTIGLVGGVASGKSLVGQLFVELGAGLLDADRTGHELLANDSEVRSALLERWGKDILDSAGNINRSAVGSRVFGDSPAANGERKFLESLLHPRIQAALDGQRRAFAAASCQAVVLDAPLLLEVGWGSQCDAIVMVDAPREIRLQRAIQRGWNEAEFARRETAQWPVETKLSAADFVIDNRGSVDDLRNVVRKIWRQILAN